MPHNDWKKRRDIVYSTRPDFDYSYPEPDEPDTLAPAAQKLRVQIEKKGRGGKVVTTVSGFIGTEADCALLAKWLKTRCGVGGSCKDGVILIQGDLKAKLIELLRAQGYTQTH